MRENIKKAGHLIAIDGCDKHCARKTMERSEFSGFTHIDLEELGFVCGETEVTDQIVEKAFKKVCKLLGES